MNFSCNSPLPDDVWVEVFSLYMFFFGYCIPVVVVTFCYTMLVRMLRQRYELNSKSENSKTRLVHRVREIDFFIRMLQVCFIFTLRIATCSSVQIR